MNFFSLLDWLLVLLLPPCELNSVPKESPAVQIQRFRPLSLLWWCFYSNTLNNKITAQLTTLQVWNTWRLKNRSRWQPWFYLPKKSEPLVWKYLISSFWGERHDICSNIYERNDFKEKRYALRVHSTALFSLWENISSQLCRNQKGENKQKQLEMTSEAKSKTNSLRNILFFDNAYRFNLSGVGLGKGQTRHLFPLLMKYKGLLQMFGVRLLKHGSSHAGKYSSLKLDSVIQMAQGKQRLWSGRRCSPEMKACSPFQKRTSRLFRVPAHLWGMPPPAPGFTHCAGVCFATHDLHVFTKRRMKSSCPRNSNYLCCWCAVGLSGHAKLRRERIHWRLGTTENSLRFRYLSG